MSEASGVAILRRGLFDLSGEMMTQRFAIGSFLNSGIGIVGGILIFPTPALVAGIHLKVLSKEIELGRPLPGGLGSRALDGVKVLLKLEGKGVELLVNKALSKKNSPRPEHRNRHRQGCSI